MKEYRIGDKVGHKINDSLEYGTISGYHRDKKKIWVKFMLGKVELVFIDNLVVCDW